MSWSKEIFHAVVVKTIQQAYAYIAESMPQFMVGVIVLIVGVGCAFVLRKIISKLLKFLGFDVLSERIGFKKFLEKGGYTKNPSTMIGFCFYWIILFSTIMMFLNTMHLKVASKFLENAGLYVPKFLVAIVLLGLGVYISRFLGKFVMTTLRLANIPFAEGFGITTSYLVIGLSVMIALEQIGVVKTVAGKTFFTVLAVVPGLFFIIFLIGGKEVISNIIAGHFLRKKYETGDNIEIGDIRGTIVSIDLLSIQVNADEKEVFLPNLQFVQKEVRRTKH